MGRITIKGGGGASSFTELTDTPNTLENISDKIRVNSETNAIEFYQEEDDSGGEPLSLTFLERLDNLGASQAVASDGKYLYVTGYPFGDTGHDHIMKYTKDGTLILDNPNATSDGTFVGTQVNSMDIKDGLLYVSCNNYASPQTDPADSVIKVFKSSDLTYVTEYQVHSNICEGYSWYDGYWWGVYNDLMVVSQRNPDFTHVTDHTLSYVITGSFNYQGIIWVDNYIMCPIHEGTSTPLAVDVYEWDGANFNEVRRIDQISTGAGQGLFKEPGKNIIWFAERGNPTTANNNVVKTRLNYVIPSTNKTE